MATQIQLDREFVRAVGIEDTFNGCDMCQLLSMDSRRKDEELAIRSGIIESHTVELAVRQKRIRMWQLATFAAGLMAILFAWLSVRGAA